LHLWHAFSYQPLATHATISRLILISSTAEKSPARSGDLKFFDGKTPNCRHRARAKRVFAIRQSLSIFPT
jgi:hypothetical protein